MGYREGFIYLCHKNGGHMLPMVTNSGALHFCTIEKVGCREGFIYLCLKKRGHLPPLVLKFLPPLVTDTEARCKEGNIQIMLFSSFRVGRRYGAGAAAVVVVKFLGVLCMCMKFYTFLHLYRLFICRDCQRSFTFR